MTDDRELLRRYAEKGSQPAFAELVGRHIDFVYACALRRVGGDTGLAEDVVQVVFSALAQQARKLTTHTALTGWLFVTTRYASARVARGERRRHAREQEAHTMMNDPSADAAGHAEWERLRPVLDAALDQLNERDREAVLLRFFERCSFVEIGERLSLTESAARMRVARALDKLHGLLAGRGVASTAAALGLVLASHTAVAAPTGLATAVIGTALAGGAVTTVASTSATTFAVMSATKLQIGLAVAVLAAGTGVVVQERGIARLRTDLALVTSTGERFGPVAPKANIPTVVQSLSPQQAQELQRRRDEADALKAEALTLENRLPGKTSSETDGTVQPLPFKGVDVADQARQAQDARQELALRLQLARDELARLRERYRDKHPEVVTLTKNVAELEALLAQADAKGLRLKKPVSAPGWF